MYLFISGEKAGRDEQIAADGESVRTARNRNPVVVFLFFEWIQSFDTRSDTDNKKKEKRRWQRKD